MAVKLQVQTLVRDPSAAPIGGVILVTAVFGLFIVAAALRIRNSWRALHNDNTPRAARALRMLDLVFSGVVLVASAVFYSVFLLNAGH